jgi:Cof subfamily protein (haloacid dehalogenase superfamily)
MVLHSEKKKYFDEIRLLALDLDGTLLRRDYSIGERTRKAVHEAHRRGIRIVLNSGRMTPSMERPADLLGLDVYLISYNGAVGTATRAENRKCLFHQPILPDVAGELVALATDRHLQLNYYLDEIVYSEDHADLAHFVELYKKRTGAPYRMVESLASCTVRAPTKALFVMESADRDALYDELQPAYANRATVVKTEPEYLEFLHPKVNKGVGLAGLCESLGIEMSQVMAIGDSDNDEPVVRAAGWGVGVANAKEKVRAAADAITENDCDHDGVAEALERWVL